MGKVLFTDVKNEYVLDIEVPTADGMVKNVDQPKEFQVVATIDMVSTADMSEYIYVERVKGKEVTRMNPEACCKKYCSKLTGFGSSITDGKTLVKYRPRNKTINHAIMAIMNIACNGDDDDEKGEV